MNIKQLEKASYIIGKLKDLDAEIINLEKYAMRVASGEKDIDINLSIPKPAEEKKEKILDEDGSLIFGGRTFGGFLTSLTYNPYNTLDKTETEKDTISYKANERVALQILGVILHDKQWQRSVLLNDLNKMGVKI